MKRILLSLISLSASVSAIQGQSASNLTLKQALDLLPVHTSGYFATIDGDKPDVRGWQYQGFENGKFFFATANNKHVYSQMQKNRNVAFACGSGDYQFRINGKMSEVTDKSEKQRLFSKLSPGVQKIYKSWDNPLLVIFTVSDGRLRISHAFGPYQTIVIQ
ncbi:MAG: pyridoxamine 5'-phosphate oxidase family protein [Prevotellaceae bacterium]|jgi:uncharacterized pyridoxamine 5'-phosphate oxidase family protein|nr:pyridoxamine 5'-phosphate oxidase family protein [Prevotellaceae bacterium]